ncbi:MAG TPA: MarR family transcriptional regulator [Caldimonas sp.]|nr:MarR family transcriptional regulator [Caldimonas sp.]
MGKPLIGALLRFPREVVVERMLEAVNAGGHDLSAAELNMLMYPGPDGKRPSALARECGMSRQSVNYLLAGLEARDYLRRADGESGVARVVHLSPRGRSVGLLMRKTVVQIEREWTKVLGTERFEALRDTLVDLSRALGKL